VRNELTPTQVSKALGVGRLYVYELLASSRLRARKVLGRWLIERSEVDAYRRKHPRFRKPDHSRTGGDALNTRKPRG
jgi:excisionase family DNA binding protein